MKTPNTKAGQLTEKIMLEVESNLPDIETHEYNRTYEAVHKVLSSELSLQLKNNE